MSLTYIVLGIMELLILYVMIAPSYQSKLEKQKAEGKWDYVLEEYLPYLHSHSEPVKTTEVLSFISYNGSGTANFKGKVHYNAAGIVIERISKSGKSRIYEFFRGKDEPSKFKPSFESSLYNIEKYMKSKNDIVFNIVYSSSGINDIIIREAPDYLLTELKKVLPNRK